MNMTLKPALEIVAVALSVAALTPFGVVTQAQTATPSCKPPQVIPIEGAEPPARLVVGAPQPGPLASRGVVILPYCAENMRLEAVFGPGALAVSPRIGHVHVTVDDAPWHWADASGSPIILRGLPAGAHKVLIQLVDANHQAVDEGTVTFEVPRIPKAVEP